MFWLVSQMWAWLLGAALAGGLIGWAWRGRRCRLALEGVTSRYDAAMVEVRTLRAAKSGISSADDDKRVAALEAELSAERDEIAGLKAKLAAASAVSATAGVVAGAVASSDVSDADKGTSEKEAGAQEDVGALTWRNRYLESRVRFLEGKLADCEGDGSGSAMSDPDQSSENEVSVASAAVALAPTDEDMDAARLKWRNRYLEGRVKYLEEDAAARAALEAEASDKTGATSGVSSMTGDLGASALDFIDGEKAAPHEVDFTPDYESSVAPVTGGTPLGGAALTQGVHQGAQDSDPAVFTYSLADENVLAGDDTGKPVTLKSPRDGQKDDLRKIAGVGPKIEKILNDLGIYHFDQIASWNRKEVEWVDSYLTFKGRIDREKWIEQCQKFARGEGVDGK